MRFAPSYSREWESLDVVILVIRKTQKREVLRDRSQLVYLGEKKGDECLEGVAVCKRVVEKCYGVSEITKLGCGHGLP